MTATAAAAPNCQTPTGMVHAGQMASVHGRKALIPACMQVNGYTGLRASWETSAEITCRRCAGTTTRKAPEAPEAKKARRQAERRASDLHYAESRVQLAASSLANLASIACGPDTAEEYAADMAERLAALQARRAELAALQA